MIRKKIETNDWEILQDETCTVDRIVFEALIKDVKLKYGLGFSKMYRDMPEGEFIKNVINEMENLMFIRKNDDTQQIKICPLVGKIQGNYPEDFKGENTNE